MDLTSACVEQTGESKIEEVFVTGAIVSVKTDKDGVYHATQVTQEGYVPPESVVEGRQKFSVSFGPVKLSGYIDTDIWQVVVQIAVFGISLGRFEFDPRKGFEIKVDLLLVKGSIRFFLKGKDLWVHIGLKWPGGSYDQDNKVIG